LSTIQTDLSCTPLFHDALGLNVSISRVFRVAVEVISVCLEMEIDSGVFSDWRVMDFRRRPGPDEPDAQVIEDGPDHRRVFDAADDPHGALTFRTDQGIDFVDLLYQPGPVSPEDFFIPLRLDDGGNGVIVSFHLPFTL
jgi:hypothetical protein